MCSDSPFFLLIKLISVKLAPQSPIYLALISLLQLAGKNSHHIIEASFKAFARALRQATEYDLRRRGTVPRFVFAYCKVFFSGRSIVHCKYSVGDMLGSHVTCVQIQSGTVTPYCLGLSLTGIPNDILLCSLAAQKVSCQGHSATRLNEPIVFFHCKLQRREGCQLWLIDTCLWSQSHLLLSTTKHGVLAYKKTKCIILSIYIL